MTIFNQELVVELSNITTVDLAHKAKNLLEKIFWAFIGLSGTIWAVYFIALQVESTNSINYH